MKKIYFLLLFFFVMWSFLSAEEPPHPIKLGPDWWKYFEAEEKELKSRADLFSQQLTVVAESASPELIPLLEEIKRNLVTFIKAKTRPQEKSPPPIQYQESYTVDALLDVIHRIRSLESTIEADQDIESDDKRQISSAQEHLLKLKRKYKEMTDPTEEKLKVGLQWIDFQLALGVLEEKFRYHQQSLKVDQQLYDQYRKELDFASENIVPQKQALDIIDKAVLDAEAKWFQKQQDLQQYEIYTLTEFSFDTTSENERLQNQLLQQGLTEAEIRAAHAQHNYLLLQMEAILARLNQPDSPITVDQLNQSIKEWKLAHASLSEEAKHWDEHISKLIHRTERANSSLRQKGIEAQIYEQLLEKMQSSLLVTHQLIERLHDSQFILKLLTRHLEMIKGRLHKWTGDLADSIASSFQNALNWMNQELFQIGKTSITFLGILQFLLIIIIAIWLTRITDLTLNRLTKRRKGIRKSLLYRINRLIHYTILTLGFLIALSSIGFDFSNFLLIAGALGVGLGFGLQAIFNNFISGIIILFENQLKVGDYVELESGVKGEVKEINFRSTYIITNDGIAVVIPNSEFVNNRVINWTLKDPFRRVRIKFFVAYDADKDKVEQVVKEAVLKVPLTLQNSWAPEPRIFIENLAKDCIEFQACIWVNDDATKRSAFTRSLYLWAIHDALVKNHIRIPFPQYDVHLSTILGNEKLEDLPQSVQEYLKKKK